MYKFLIRDLCVCLIHLGASANFGQAPHLAALHCTYLHSVHIIPSRTATEGIIRDGVGPD